MSASSGCRNALLVLVLGATGTALAAEAGGEPEMELIEYLGLWEETDEEWLMVEHQMAMESEEERIDPVPEGEESREDDDES